MRVSCKADDRTRSVIPPCRRIHTCARVLTDHSQECESVPQQCLSSTTPPSILMAGDLLQDKWMRMQHPLELCPFGVRTLFKLPRTRNRSTFKDVPAQAGSMTSAAATPIQRGKYLHTARTRLTQCLSSIGVNLQPTWELWASNMYPRLYNVYMPDSTSPFAVVVNPHAEQPDVRKVPVRIHTTFPSRPSHDVRHRAPRPTMIIRRVRSVAAVCAVLAVCL